MSIHFVSYSVARGSRIQHATGPCLAHALTQARPTMSCSLLVIVLTGSTHGLQSTAWLLLAASMATELTVVDKVPWGW